MSLLEISHLTTKFETQQGTVSAVRDVSYHLEEGEVLGIVGESGSGKSTLMNIIGVLDRQTEGTYFLEGKDVNKMDDSMRSAIRNKRIGFVFQNFNLLPKANALKNVMVPLLYSTEREKNQKERAMEMLKMVGMEERAFHKPNELSGGQKQRVAIAGVMAMEPKCIVLDEPTAMLDPNGRKEVLHAAHELNRKKGVTILLITHYMEEVVDADYVYVMDKGHVVMQGTPREIFSQVGTLKEHRLDVPQITLLADLLRQSGLDIPLGVLTREELVDAIMKIAG